MLVYKDAPWIVACAVASILACAAVSNAQETETPAPSNPAVQILFDFEGRFDIGKARSTDAKVRLVSESGGKALRLDLGHDEPWPGIALDAPMKQWDLSAHGALAIDVINVGKHPGEIECRVDNRGANPPHDCVSRRILLAPGESGVLKVPLSDRRRFAERSIRFFGMRGSPSLKPVFDPARVIRLLVFTPRPKVNLSFRIDNIRAVGLPERPRQAEHFFPMIDCYGQYIHGNWPGKIRSEGDFSVRRDEEEKDLAANPRPRNWSRYGGWKDGLPQEATGSFRVARVDGKWWFIDPEGFLFWSHGIDEIRDHDSTPITDRKYWYRELPNSDSPFARFYGKGTWAPHGYYHGKTPYETYDFYRANLLRKYGAEWTKIYADLTHRRLASWAMNTMGSWTQAHICRLSRTPYTVTLSTRGKAIVGSEGIWCRFPDVFDPDFGAGFRKRLEGEKTGSAVDPWCIGYFVDNELDWGDERYLAMAALKSPPEQAAKRAFIDDLRKRYDSIGRLNEVWGTQHASWDALAQHCGVPDQGKANADLQTFSSRVVETYFRTIREAIRELAPGRLYLGCRFSKSNERAVRIAARFCDVVTFNKYDYSVGQFRLPKGCDKPVLVGEFHFGALDRGMFHTGLRKARDQQHRARLYEDYVRGALRNPIVIGTHWFRYNDQPTTGRGDGENYQIGFTDNCGTPYPEIIAASRRVGQDMYVERAR